MKRVLFVCVMVAMLFAQQSIREGVNDLTESVQALLAFVLFIMIVPMGLVALGGAAAFFIAKSERNRKIGMLATIGAIVIIVILVLLYVLVPVLVGSMLPTT